MESFIELANKGLKVPQGDLSDFKTGGPELNTPINTPLDYDYHSRDRSNYGSALKYISINKHEHNEAIDEDAAHEAHDKAYNQGGAKDLSAGAMGSAAALQALKTFTDGGNSLELINLAMAEASKLFDESGGAASGNKQDVLNGAAMTVVKLLVQSRAGSSGEGNSGGMSSLMDLASKFT